MKSLHLTMMAFCHILLASSILYLTTFTTNLEASPLVGQQQNIAQIIKPAQQQNVEQAAPINPIQQSAIQSSEDKISKVLPVEATSQIDQVKKVEDSPLVGKSSPIATNSKVVEAAELKKEQPTPVKEAEAPVVVAKSAEVPVQEPAKPIKESKINEQHSSPVVVESQLVVSKQEKADVVLKAPEVPIENKQQDSKSSIQYQAPVIESNDKPVVESKKPEFAKIEQAINGKNADEIKPIEPAVSKVIIQHNQAQMPVALPQPAALVAGPKESPVDSISGKSEAKEIEVKSVVIKNDAPEKANVDSNVVPPKVERKLDEQPEQVQQAKVTVEEPNKIIGVAQQPAMAESPSEIVGKRLYNPAPSAPITPVVKGGLGPLQLLATTLCSYQPDKQVADDCLNQLYSRRANLRKSLLEFMSLKFTNLEKLSSRLGSGLQVVPLKTVGDMPTANHNSQPAPSHGWPVVGKCTAHDLKLMGEASWCEGEPGNASGAAADTTTPSSSPSTKTNDAATATAAVATTSTANSNNNNNAQAVQEEYAPKITSNQHVSSSRVQAARSIGSSSSSLSFLPSPEQSSVISKLLHVGDIKDAPVVESTIYNLNLTQQQLASLEAQATSTRECRRNALRYTKALFNHLAEDQRNVSETWPHLYALINADDCARKRMIDIITALSSFRTDTTSIRRDNLEFAFAMDDLRTKVLENEINVPLTFDKQFIEVEQFLQQSVRLMLSNIDPNRAKLTSMRYRSLMYGTANSDDQCIELHQRLLAQSYPTDCNPNQFGQLPDVLRMTASSLELWSIEKEISLRTSKTVDYPNSDLVGQQKIREDVNECIANLVSS